MGHSTPNMLQALLLLVEVHRVVETEAVVEGEEEEDVKVLTHTKALNWCISGLLQEK